MTSAQPTPQATPSLPIENGPQTAIPQTDIPHMGTSQASVANPSIEGTAHPQAQVQAQPSNQPPVQPPAQSSAQSSAQPLPPGVTQDAIDAAIAHVQQTGNTDGIAPEVLGAACAQIEARAVAEGVDLSQVEAAQAPASPPTSHVEAAVMDKQGTMDAFEQQRQSITGAVAEQRETMQQPYKDALAKVGADNSAEIDPKSMSELASAIKDLDPATVALINAMGALNANPNILNSVIWIEMIRTVRAWIASEAKKQVQEALHTPAA